MVFQLFLSIAVAGITLIAGNHVDHHDADYKWPGYQGVSGQSGKETS
jgi:hypothetical protein